MEELIMNNNLVLVTNERFGELECNIYQDRNNGECYFTREQIGTALEYSDPRNAIKNIHARNQRRLDTLSIRVPIEKGVGVNLSPTPSNGGTGGEKETVLYTRKGVFEICRWSRQPKADAFMDFVWEVTDRLMSGEVTIISKEQTAAINQKLGEMAVGLQAIADKIETISQKVDKVEKEVSYCNYYLRLQMRSGYDKNWVRRQSKNINVISEFIGVDGKHLLQEIYLEMENRYGIVLEKFAADYKRTKGVSTCSTLSVISLSLTLREMFDAIIKEIMSICHITPIEDAKASGISRIFDIAEEAAEDCAEI